jgi:hypothetical protein
MSLAFWLVTRRLLEPNQRTATDAVALQLTCAFDMALVLGGIEVAFRFCDVPSCV